MSKLSDDDMRHAAATLYHVDGALEIDDDAKVSRTDDGAYVQAWVWLSNEEADLSLSRNGPRADAGTKNSAP